MAVTFEVNTSKLDRLIAVVGQGVKTRLIADGVEYGVFQEFSTSPGGNPQTNPAGRKGITGKGHPSLIPAFERVTKDLPKAVGVAIENIIPLDDVFNKAAFDIQALWAADVNVDTGAYKNSIGVHEE
jgi:hypothetical protein